MDTAMHAYLHSKMHNLDGSLRNEGVKNQQKTPVAESSSPARNGMRPRGAGAHFWDHTPHPQTILISMTILPEQHPGWESKLLDRE